MQDELSENHINLKGDGLLVEKYIETITMDDPSGRRCRSSALTARSVTERLVIPTVRLYWESFTAYAIKANYGDIADPS